MTRHGRIRVLAAAAVLLAAALAGCAAAAGSAAPVMRAAPPGTSDVALAAATAGCPDVNQATSVVIEQLVQVAGPVNGGMREVTDRNVTRVRALLHDFCAALSTAAFPRPGFDCVAEFGNSYQGTFYGRHRTLATFVYSLRGCPQLRLTAAGKTRDTFVLGKSAAAAPHLKADLAAVLGSRGS